MLRLSEVMFWLQCAANNNVGVAKYVRRFICKLQCNSLHIAGVSRNSPKCSLSFTFVDTFLSCFYHLYVKTRTTANLIHGVVTLVTLYKINFKKRVLTMQKQNETKLFAFKLAEKNNNNKKEAAKWQVRDGVATAGCSGPDARADSRYGRDNGIWC